MTGLFSGHVDTKSPTPLYHQIFLDFKHRIISGNLADGFKFPSEEKLAKEFDVSRITIKRALNELAQQGLVERHRGSGTVVTYVASNLPNNDGFTALMDSLRKIAATTTVEVLSVDLVKPPPSIAQHLALPNSQYAQQIHRKRYYQNDPFSYVLSYSPEKVGKSWTKEELSKKTGLSADRRRRVHYRMGAPNYLMRGSKPFYSTEPNVARRRASSEITTSSRN
jgi:GntR family transcriptional regulator